MGRKVRNRWKKVLQEQQASKKPVSYDCSRIIVNLPQRTPQEIEIIRNNAFEIIASEEKKLHHTEARRLIKTIYSEFIRRYGGKIDENGFFYWPRTDIGSKRTNSVFDCDWTEDGVLSHFGYRVGTTEGKSKNLRHVILSEVFEGIIPPIFDLAYLREWGGPASAKRLQKSAETIASLARNAKRRGDVRLQVAIREWEEDLEFLYWTYYVDRFRFGWPLTKVS